jgi:hypothetical protein
MFTNTNLTSKPLHATTVPNDRSSKKIDREETPLVDERKKRVNHGKTPAQPKESSYSYGTVEPTLKLTTPTTPPPSKGDSLLFHHVLGATILEGTKEALLAASTKKVPKSKWPATLQFRGDWNGVKDLRIFIDNGCTAECLINEAVLKRLSSKAQARGKPSSCSLLTGAGIIESNGSIFYNQAITSNGFRQPIKEAQSANLERLPYDIVLGLPWLQRTQAIPRWRTGELTFTTRASESKGKKRTFKWIPPTETDEELHMCAITQLQAEHMAREKGATFVLLSVTEIEKIATKMGATKDKAEEANLPSASNVIPESTTTDGSGDDSVKSNYTETAERCVSSELSEEQHATVVKLLEEFSEGGITSLFTQKDNLPSAEHFGTRPEHWKMKIPLKPEGRSPKASSRRFSEKEMEEIERILNYLLTHKFIRPSTSRFASPILLVRKKDGNFRFCCDFRMLNEASFITQGPLPDIRSLTDRLQKARYLSAVDCVNGYWQLPLSESDKWKTAMRTPFGLFEWEVVVMGLAGSASHFQKVMNELVGPMTEHGSYCANLLDDILIYSETFEEHLTNLRAVLTTLNEANFYLNLAKCKFFEPRLLYLGNIVGSGERKPDPDKIRALLEHPEPTTATELRAFLGIGNYLAPYIKDWSQLTACYGDLRALGKNKRIRLTAEQVIAFNKLKKALTEAPVLKLPDFKKRFYLQVDASKTGAGSALLQEYEGTLRPIAYRSTLLTKAQKNWPIHDLEAFSLLDGTKHFRPYLADAEFTVLSDHKPLEHLKSQEKLNMRQIRWLDHLAMFNFKFVYIPGEDNLYADPMSRPPGHSISVTDARPDFKESTCALCRLAAEDEALEPFDVTDIPGLPARKVFDHTCAILVHLHPISKTSIKGLLDIDTDRIKEGYKHCPFSKEMLKILNDEDNTQHHYNRKYTVIEGLVYLVPNQREGHHRMLVPNYKEAASDRSIREDLIRLHHDPPTEGHREADTTYLRIRERFYFPNMHKAVQKYCRTCDSCLRNKYMTCRPTGLLQPVEYPVLQPHAEIATDFAVGLPSSVRTYTGVVYNAVQVIVCRLSRKVRLLPCRDTDTAELTARNYMDHVFPQSGLPRSIVSDRDPKFTSEFWSEISKIIGTRLRMTSSHNPRADGLSEKVVGVVTTMIRIYVSWNQTDWVDKLALLEFALNRHASRSRGSQSPFMIADGFEPFSATDLAMPTPQMPHGKDAFEYVRKQKVAAQSAQDAIIAAQDAAANVYNKKRSTQVYKVGEFVLLKSAHVYPPGEREKPSEKLRHKYVGPFEITRLVGPNAIEVRLTGGLKNHPVFSIDSTKPFPQEARKDKSSTAPAEDGVDQDYVQKVIAYKFRRKRRMWLVEWQGFTQDVSEEKRTWEPFESFISSQGINQQLVEYEEERTKLRGTTETTWNYQAKDPGTLSVEADGFRVYHSKSEKFTAIAKKLSVSCNDLYEQNVLAYLLNGSPHFKTSATLKVGTQLRLPRPI